MQSDNGVESVNETIQEITNLSKIEHRTISAYHPRANGAVERVTKDIEAMFRKVLTGLIQN